MVYVVSLHDQPLRQTGFTVRMSSAIPFTEGAPVTAILLVLVGWLGTVAVERTLMFGTTTGGDKLGTARRGTGLEEIHGGIYLRALGRISVPLSLKFNNKRVHVHS